MFPTDTPLANWFLLLTGIVFLFLFALPLMFAPLHWARFFQWRVPDGPKDLRDLILYFARCLGAVAFAVIVAILHAAFDPAWRPMVLKLIVWIGVPMVGVHAWGAVRRQQPWTETMEIGLYAGVTVLAAYILQTLP
jgi:hypothetical protein